MLLRLHKKLFNIRVKFEDLNMILSDDDFESPEIDLGIHLQNIQTSCSPSYIIQDAINNDDLGKLRKLINNWSWDGETALYPVNNDNINDVVKFSIQALGNNANLNWIDTSNVTDMSGLFGESKFNGDISNWNVSNVTSMECMFANSQFNGDISKWDVSNVTDMSYMFYKNFDFESDISEWNVSNVKDMRCMFAKTYSFDQKNISNWEINDETDKTNMFLDAHSPNGL